MNDPIPLPSEPSDRFEDVSECVKRMCLALTQVELFSPAHPLARKAVASAYEWLAGMFTRRRDPVVLTVSDKKVILDGIAIDDKSPLIAKFGAKLDSFRISNLFIEPGITQEEFQTFYDIIGKGGRVIAQQGGLTKLMSEASLSHLRLRDVSYVMVTEGQRVVSGDTDEGQKKPAVAVRERRRKPRRPVAQAVEDGVAKRLAGLNLDATQIEAVVTSLSVFVEERAREKAAEYREEAQRLETEVARQTQALGAIPWGVLFWDDDFRVAFINPAAAQILQQPEGIDLRPAVAALLTQWTYPLTAVPNFPPEAALAESEIRLVLSVMTALRAADGKVRGVILMPER